MNAASDGSVLRAAFEATELSRAQLWLRYFALGGDADIDEMDAYLSGRATPTSHQHDVLAQALNEELIELGGGFSVPYRDVV